LTSNVRIGVIGLGIMGEQYVRVYQDHPQAEVVAVASRSLEKAQAAGRRQDFQALGIAYVDFALAGSETGRGSGDPTHARTRTGRRNCL